MLTIASKTAFNSRWTVEKCKRSPSEARESHSKRRRSGEKCTKLCTSKPRKLLEAWANREKFPIELRANSEKIIIEPETKPRNPLNDRTNWERSERTHTLQALGTRKRRKVIWLIPPVCIEGITADHKYILIYLSAANKRKLRRTSTKTPAVFGIACSTRTPPQLWVWAHPPEWG